MNPLLITLAILLVSSNGHATEPKPFTSDGCSSFPNGTMEQQDLWLSCCEKHDKAYWAGGTYQQRQQADLDLKECVTSVGKPSIAKLMLAGVRVGGSPYWPTSFRWGYGWEFPKKYAELSSNEKQQVTVKWQEYLKSKQ